MKIAAAVIVVYTYRIWNVIQKFITKVNKVTGNMHRRKILVLYTSRYYKTESIFSTARKYFSQSSNDRGTLSPSWNCENILPALCHSDCSDPLSVEVMSPSAG